MNDTKPVARQPSCADAAEPGVLSVAAALARMGADVVPVAGVEKIALRGALGRVLAGEVLSPVNVPSHTNSAMDGYALGGDDLPGSGGAVLSVIGTAYAGTPYPGTVAAGQCVRIMTGAMMPAGTDSVVMQEHAERDGDTIRIDGGHRRGQNVRQAGEDLAAGQPALHAGQWIGPAELGLLASLGVAEVRVRRRLRVAFFSTGDELRSIGEPLGEGEIYDSNRYTLHGMLTRLGAEVLDMGVVRDTPAALREAFGEAAAMADVVMTSGGVSVGEADYVKETLAELGRVDFWKIAMKPGRPLAFGRLGASTFIGLPGNPVAVMVAFYQFARPLLRRLQGETDTDPVRFTVPCLTALKKRPGRTEYQRGVLHRDAEGRLVVRTTGAQGSGILRSMSEANCFVVLGHDQGRVEPGDPVEVQPFLGLI
ncbi:MAG: bifunctional molybdopterin-guanine dinucleotide biosynthesis adaptor protein MobB/molybdopterin molybdotransferase MoeA [Gammaproteobacteria bacterium]|nr:bifunctional molybdopterin-guanine dinucleotide biosynthesis adaptor protein MobB/molybdopterin molybdotransferase MoeA [Gammaproteobacteria bacterium]